ncbi:hypothetical protein LEAN103870_08465 [Legionella anisa]|uniref:Uncharacterized protein n=1 Tax=Legionella anisa TaxID=28082 RepID=A0AAX0WZN3_9GAMM|nr:hypothetical protein [Legionella anisa]AWN73716.1 hypothetical protein DLD14_07600 [Legionella anisa]KTC70324.1 hypothetical protein Lani_1871 [Legionella anisa]MBN5936389.1 hypothetical protein [Legionella anisa]MCW8426609.1 hypothetical protein [Legionella anisa]MCW8448272.1 hypothetical protein [Legionella anisa]
MPGHPIFKHTKSFWDNEESGFFHYFNEAFFAKQAEKALERFKNKTEAKIRKDERHSFMSGSDKERYIQKRLNRELKEQANNPNISGIGPYKLHISLSPDSYTPKLRDQITNIILKYPGAVRDFKYVDALRLQAGLDQLNEFNDALTQLKSKVKKGGQLIEENDKQIFTAIKRSFESHLDPRDRWATWRTVTREHIDELDKLVRKELEKQKKAHERFLSSDQFTLYIPTTPNKQEILRMCQEIHALLIESEAQPGGRAPTEVGLGQFINFRQELFLEDYRNLSKDPSRYEYARISAHEKDAEKVEKIQSEMTQCELYQYLHSKFNTPLPTNKWQAKWERASGTTFDKACALLLDYSCSHASNDGVKTSYWGGSIGRFFSGRWGTHHGDAVQNALNRCNNLREEEQTLANLLTAIQEELGVESTDINPVGDLRSILTVIWDNTHYGQEIDSDLGRERTLSSSQTIL